MPESISSWLFALPSAFMIRPELYSDALPSQQFQPGNRGPVNCAAEPGPAGIVSSEMSDSPSQKTAAVEARPGKRDRLVAAAVQLLHQHGIERTTLADIAQLADVPAGNVYYYFKSKDDVIAAVVEAHVQQVRTTLESIDSGHRSPKIGRAHV